MKRRKATQTANVFSQQTDSAKNFNRNLNFICALALAAALVLPNLLTPFLRASAAGSELLLSSN